MFNQRDLGREEMFGAIYRGMLRNNAGAIDLACPGGLQVRMLVSFSPIMDQTGSPMPQLPTCVSGRPHLVPTFRRCARQTFFQLSKPPKIRSR